MSPNPQVQLVGILNLTPDSFSDGGEFVEPAKAIEQARQMFADGATWVDVGAEATNPWATPIKPEVEWTRLEPVLPALISEFPGLISLDTHHPETARRAMEIGVTILNDVTMFRLPEMVALAAEYRNKARFIISHLSPKARSIADAHELNPTQTVREVKDDLLVKRQELMRVGVPAANIILDPGIGFGKSTGRDYQLHRDLLRFAEEVPGIDVLIGHSRKRFLGKNKEDIARNLEAARVAIASGAKYLRVHDVKAHKEFFD